MEAPTFIQIEPVGHCNLRCRMCPVRYRGTRNAFLAWETYTRIIDELPGLRELHLQGMGEPLLHPRFFDMTRYAAERGIAVSVNTNLTLLTPRNAELTAASGLEAIFVSVDGATAQTYERIREGARFDRVERNVARLLAAIAARGGGPRVELTAVAMRENLDELPALVALCARWGIGTLHVQHLSHDFGESTLPAQYAPMRDFVARQTLVDYEPQHVATAFARARAAAGARGIALRLPPVTPVVHAPGTPGRSRCDWPWRGPYITYDGTAMPCCIAATPDRAALGNVATSGVDAVWNGEAYEAFRAQLESEQPPEICRSCSVYARVF